MRFLRFCSLYVWSHSQFKVDCGGVVVRPLTSYMFETGSIPGGAAPGFSRVGIVPDDSAGRRVFSGISHFTRPLISTLLHTHLTSPSSALKTSILGSRPNLSILHSIHSLTSCKQENKGGERETDSCSRSDDLERHIRRGVQTFAVRLRAQVRVETSPSVTHLLQLVRNTKGDIASVLFSADFKTPSNSVFVRAGSSSRGIARDAVSDMTRPGARVGAPLRGEAEINYSATTSPAGGTHIHRVRSRYDGESYWLRYRSSPGGDEWARSEYSIRICMRNDSERVEDVGEREAVGAVNRKELVMEVNMERRRNEGAGETGDSRENPPTSSIVRHDSHLRKSVGATVAEWSDSSPPKASRVQSAAGSLPDFLKWRSCRTIPLVGGFSRGSPFPPHPFVPALLHAHLNSPSPAPRPHCLLIKAILILKLSEELGRLQVLGDSCGLGQTQQERHTGKVVSSAFCGFVYKRHFRNKTPQSYAYWSLNCMFIGCCPTPGSYGIRKGVSLQVCYWLRGVQGGSNKLWSNCEGDFTLYVSDVLSCPEMNSRNFPIPTSGTMVSSNTDTNRTGVHAVVDIGDALPMCLKFQKLLTYGCETWTFDEFIKGKLRTAQRVMERSMLGFIRKYKKKATYIRSVTKVKDILGKTATLEWQWAGHVARTKDERWIRTALERRPRNHRRSRGRPPDHWCRDIRRLELTGRESPKA
ncbi:hypothetical protein PR048_031293, partial [Dryococelus australis]